MKILITGGSNGMGKGVAKVLAVSQNQVHEVIILCRSLSRGQATIREIEEETKNTKTSLFLCDLTSLSDVKNVVDEIKEKYSYLDALFINAGIGYASKRIETEDGLDAHFQVNYLSQFMLTLNLLDLLEQSVEGGRVVFNVTEAGEIFWDDMQMEKKWHYEAGIHQAMVAKRMFFQKLHREYAKNGRNKVSFIGFQINETVWSNQLNIIPTYMSVMARVMKLFGRFISIDECGQIMAPLFYEKKKTSQARSGQFITWKKEAFIELIEEDKVLDHELQDRLWSISLNLCHDQRTGETAQLICEPIPIKSN